MAPNNAPSPFSLAGRRVVVTGGSSGIGRAISLACAAAGADVLVSYRENASGAEEVAAAIAAAGRRGGKVRADLVSLEDLRALEAAACEILGGVDAWINNAGTDVLTGNGAGLSRREKLERLVQVDLMGTMHASWAAAELMRTQPEGGVIINMSWDRVLQGMAGENPELFAAVKGGIQGFSRALARSLAPKVRVNVLAPGWIETAFAEQARPDFKAAVTRMIPLGRWGTAEDVAGAAVYLASDAARYLTGQTIMVNGGDVM